MAHTNTEHVVIQKARRLLDQGVFNEDTDAIVREYLSTIEFHSKLGNERQVTMERNVLAEKLQGY